MKDTLRYILTAVPEAVPLDSGLFAHFPVLRLSDIEITDS